MDKTKQKVIVCGRCGSSSIIRDFFGYCDVERQKWVIEDMRFNATQCLNCNAKRGFSWRLLEGVAPAKPLPADPF